MPRFSLKPWTFYILIILAIIFCVRLGFWQLYRAEQKKQMMRQYQRLAKKTPILLSKQSKPLPYQPAKLKGRFLPPLLYLDNQHYQHQFGYDIISPFQTHDGLTVLINRGWVAGDITRQHLPKIDTPRQLTTIKGYAYYPKNNAWRLGPQIEVRQGGRYLLEQIDIKALNGLLPYRLASYILRLQQRTGEGFVQAWPIVSMSPNRHKGYALQWFVMALGLVMMLYFARPQFASKKP